MPVSSDNSTATGPATGRPNPNSTPDSSWPAQRTNGRSAAATNWRCSRADSPDGINRHARAPADVCRRRNRRYTANSPADNVVAPAKPTSHGATAPPPPPRPCAAAAATPAAVDGGRSAGVAATRRRRLAARSTRQ